MRGWILCAALAAACGGKVERGGDETPMPGHDEPSVSEHGPGQIDLPPCELGFSRDEHPDRFCAWMTSDGRCYETKVAACACACQEGEGDFCSSPFFDAPESQIPVDCF